MPELTYYEAERLWAHLGCTQQEWDSVDKNKVSIIPSYDNWSFPFFFIMMSFFYYDGGAFFTKYIDSVTRSRRNHLKFFPNN